MTQYSIRPKRSAIRAQAVYFCIRRCLVSRACDWVMSGLSVICRVTYFQFPIQSAFLPYIGRQAAPALRRTIGFNTKYRTADVAKNVGRYVSCTERTTQWKDFELMLTVKMKTRHPVEGQFGSEFSAICNDCGVTVARSHKTWIWTFLRFFWKKRPLMVKMQNSIAKFLPPHRSTLIVVYKCRKTCPTGNWWNRVIYLKKTKFRLPVKLPLLGGSRPKSTRASPQQYAHSVPDFIQIGSLSAEL